MYQDLHSLKLTVRPLKWMGLPSSESPNFQGFSIFRGEIAVSFREGKIPLKKQVLNIYHVSKDRWQFRHRSWSGRPHITLPVGSLDCWRTLSHGITSHGINGISWVSGGCGGTTLRPKQKKSEFAPEDRLYTQKGKRVIIPTIHF